MAFQHLWLESASAPPPPPVPGGGQSWGGSNGGWTPGPPPRNPWLVGPTADKVLAFLVSLLFSLLAMIGVIVVAWVWAGQAWSPDDRIARNAHARGVTIWALMGGVVVPLALVILFLVVFAAAFTVTGPLS